MWGKHNAQYFIVKCGTLSHPYSYNDALKCVQGLNQNFFSVILIQAKHCQKTVETSQPSLNVLHVFIIIKKKVWFNPFM